MTEEKEAAFDAFVIWWETGREEFPDLQRPDPRVGAAYTGFLAGYMIAKEEVV